MRALWREAWSSLALPLAALRMLLRERSLWSVALVPLALSGAACAGTLLLLVTHAAALDAWCRSWLPEVAVAGGLGVLWTAPLWLLARLASGLLFLLVSAAALLAALLLAGLLAAPFHEILSRRVEGLVLGRVEEWGAGSWSATWRAAARSVVEELRRLGFFLVLQALLGAFGWLVPGGALVAAPAMTLLTLLFLPLDTAAPLLDRRGVLRFADRRRWVLAHPAAMLGYGSACFAICLVPGLNLLAMPVLVVGGTLLALRHPPSVNPSSQAPGDRSGSATSA